MAREHFTGSILGDIIRATNGVSSMTVDQRQQNALYGIHQARVRIPDDDRPYRLILAPADVTIRTPNGIAIDEHFADRISDGDPSIASSFATPPVNQDAVREALAKGVAEVFAKRPWISMAENVVALRPLLKSHGMIPPYEADELTVDAAYQAADHLIATIPAIAATPDLLEALQLLLSDYITVAEEAGCELIGSDADPEVVRARAAIAKARCQS